MAQPLILEGTWEEIKLHELELAGRHLKVIVDSDETSTDKMTPGTPKERAAAFIAWAESHSRNTPLLSDEAISRESIYGERG